MAILPIVTVADDNPILRRQANKVRRIDRATRALMDDMIDTMRDAPGVGLAAPQVGVDQRIIVVEVPTDPDDPESEMRLHALADPEIIWRSADIEEDQEACLSIPGMYGDVPRFVAIRVRALDRSGRQIELDVADFEARVFQHEIDHLDGILYTQRVTGPDKLYRLVKNASGEYERAPLLAADAPEM
ncbi:MAG: peptide deformylase [Anaerolineae bacterium]